MSTNDPSAVEVALAYHRAWAGHDFETAMTYIAADIVCDAPSGRLEGAEAFRRFMGPFTEIVTGTNVLAAYGDATTGVVVYDTETRPVPHAPGAECVTVADGRIVAMTIIFDRVPFEAARRAAAVRPEAARSGRGRRRNHGGEASASSPPRHRLRHLHRGLVPPALTTGRSWPRHTPSRPPSPLPMPAR